MGTYKSSRTQSIKLRSVNVDRTPSLMPVERHPRIKRDIYYGNILPPASINIPHDIIYNLGSLAFLFQLFIFPHAFSVSPPPTPISACWRTDTVSLSLQGNKYGNYSWFWPKRCQFITVLFPFYAENIPSCCNSSAAATPDEGVVIISAYIEGGHICLKLLVLLCSVLFFSSILKLCSRMKLFFVWMRFVDWIEIS